MALYLWAEITLLSKNLTLEQNFINKKVRYGQGPYHKKNFHDKKSPLINPLEAKKRFTT